MSWIKLCLWWNASKSAFSRGSSDLHSWQVLACLLWWKRVLEATQLLLQISVQCPHGGNPGLSDYGQGLWPCKEIKINHNFFVFLWQSEEPVTSFLSCVSKWYIPILTVTVTWDAVSVTWGSEKDQKCNEKWKEGKKHLWYCIQAPTQH